MNWQALAEALNITTETRPVYRAGKRAFRPRTRRSGMLSRTLLDS